MKYNKLIYLSFLLTSYSSCAGIVDAINHEFSDVRIFHNTDDNIYGYGFNEKHEKSDYFEFDKQENLLTFGEYKYKYSGGNLAIEKKKNNEKVNAVLLKYFATRYGIEYSSGSNGYAYVFLDYSCPYSKKFVDDGGLKRLKYEGYNVWIMPISRMGSKEGILNFSALTCSTDQANKLPRFMRWFNASDIDVTKSEVLNSKCFYWLDLKPYYSIMERLDFIGVPSVYKVDLNGNKIKTI